MKYISNYNKNYYSYLDGIIMSSRRRRIARRYLEVATDIIKFVFFCCLFYGIFAVVWSMLCYVFPEW